MWTKPITLPGVASVLAFAHLAVSLYLVPLVMAGDYAYDGLNALMKSLLVSLIVGGVAIVAIAAAAGSKKGMGLAIAALVAECIVAAMTYGATVAYSSVI